MNTPIEKSNSVFSAFKDLEDPRKKRNQFHSLFVTAHKVEAAC